MNADGRSASVEIIRYERTVQPELLGQYLNGLYKNEVSHGFLEDR